MAVTRATSRARRALGGAAVATILLAAAVVPRAAGAAELVLADGGRAGWTIVLADAADPAETTAATELADYLGRVAGAPFAIVPESAGVPARALLVGPTAEAVAAFGPQADLDGESWLVRARPGRIVLYGGRPRGTLYAVYHFLEDEVGVRWWTPWDESVPRRPRLTVPSGDRAGRPAFSFRDVHRPWGPPRFAARNRLNGPSTDLEPDFGGRIRYGPPFFVHTFDRYVPPDEFFDSHPEYFSEIAGMRSANAQLCLTNPEVLDLVAERLEANIERSRRDLAPGEEPPRLFDFSQNDRGRPCECAACTAVAEREGSRSGPVLAFVNALADRVAEKHPDVLVDTLAYGWSIEPPAHLRARDNVAVRWAALYDRDFSRPLTDPVHAPLMRSLAGWAERVRHLRVWDYALPFADAGELPLPNLRFAAGEYRAYRALGVEGVFVQHGDPIAPDLHDLKLWVQAKLLEDPDRDVDRLVRTFVEGFYGPAAPPLLRYLRELERAARRHPGFVGYRAAPEDYAWLDARFLERAERRFDAAARRVAGDPVLARRVRHARLSLDRATLELWPGAAARGLDRDAVAERYRRTWNEQIDRRLGEPYRAAARAEVESEIAGWGARSDAP